MPGSANASWSPWSGCHQTLAPELVLAHVGDQTLSAQSQRDVHLLADDFQRFGNPFLAERAKAVKKWPADIGALGAEAERFQHILAGADTAVHMDFYSVADRVRNLFQRHDRGRRTIELAPAMVGNHDRVRAGLGRHQRILLVEDAFQDQLAAPAFLDPVDVLPRQLRIELLRR